MAFINKILQKTKSKIESSNSSASNSSANSTSGMDKGGYMYTVPGHTVLTHPAAPAQHPDIFHS
ncbi:hypothetical protein EC988_005738, partial [Linderina pennispora]